MVTVMKENFLEIKLNRTPKLNRLWRNLSDISKYSSGFDSSMSNDSDAKRQAISDVFKLVFGYRNINILGFLK